MITTRDLTLSVVAAALMAAFLLPVLLNTGYLAKLPFPFYFLVIGFAILAAVGMTVASLIGKKIAIIWQIAKFALVGFLNTSIDFGVLNLLIFLTGYTQGTGIGLINAPSFCLAILNSYFWNRKWVFEKSKSGNFFVFVAVTIIGLLINTAVIVGITTYVPSVFGISPKVWANIAKVAATAFSMVWNFAGYKLIVFKR